MNQIKMIRLIIVSVFIYCLTAIQLLGQVVTPGLNIVSKPVMPASSSWSKLNSIGGEYKDGNGKGTLDGEEVYDLEMEGSTGVIGLSIGNVDIDAYFDEVRFDTKHDASYDGAYLNDSSETYVSLSLTGEGDVTVGAAIHEINRNIYIPAPNSEDANFKQSGIIGSFSVKVSESIYIGGGIERIKETSSLTVDNEWTDITAGLALWFGQNTDSQFRVEASVTESPKAESEADPTGTKFSAEHSSSRTSRLNIDLMMNGLLFTYQNINQIIEQETTHTSTGKSVDQTESIVNEGSVQWIPEEGLILGFAFRSEEYKEIYNDKVDSFKINLGYIF